MKKQDFEFKHTKYTLTITDATKKSSYSVNKRFEVVKLEEVPQSGSLDLTFRNEWRFEAYQHFAGMKNDPKAKSVKLALEAGR
ncbi:hypothetical protein BGP_6253 [Beggiatoa sp. PS]|nr:hypothetical protein BGP_6253 [Beggiatoa sp. PS]